MSISINCQNCGKHFFVPDKFAGKNVKCKKCQSSIHVTKAAHSNLNCPSCDARVGPDDIICIQCGYNMRTHHKVATHNKSTIPNDKPRHSKSTGILVLLGALILPVAGVIFLISSGGSDKNEVNESSSRQQPPKTTVRQNQKSIKPDLNREVTLKGEKYTFTCKNKFSFNIKQKMEKAILWQYYFTEPSAKPLHFHMELERKTFPSLAHHQSNTYNPGQVTTVVTVSDPETKVALAQAKMVKSLPAMVYGKRGDSFQELAFKSAERTSLGSLTDVLNDLAANYYRQENIYKSKILPKIIAESKSKDTERRIAAIKALGSSKEVTPEIISAIAEGLKPANSVTADPAIAAFQKIGSPAALAGKYIVEYLAQCTIKKQQPAIKALRKIKTRNKEAITKSPEAMKHISSAAKNDLLHWLLDCRDNAATVLPDLAIYLGSKNNRVRDTTARLFLQNRKHISTFAPALTKQAGETKENITKAKILTILSNGGIFSDEGVAIAKGMIDEQDKSISSAATGYISSAARTLPAARNVLLMILEKGSPTAKLNAAQTLTRYVPAAERPSFILSMLKGMEGCEAEATNKVLTYSIYNCAPVADKNIENILPYTEHKRQDIRKASINALLKRYKGGNESIDKVALKALKDPSADIAVISLQNLRQKGKLSPQEASAVLNILEKKTDENSTRKALDVLSRSKGFTKENIPAMLKLMKDDDGKYAAYYLRAFGNMGKDAAGTLPEITPYLKKEKQKALAIRIVENMGPEASVAINEIIANIESKPRGSYNTGARKALCAIGREAALPVAKLLKSEDGNIRHFAATTLYYMRENALPAKSMLETVKDDPERKVSYMAKRALKNLESIKNK